MKRILVLGAGQSTPFLVHHLLSSTSEVEVVVADRDLELARARVAEHPRGRALELDAGDTRAVLGEIQRSDLVVNILAPSFQGPIARLCVEAGRSMVSASYRSAELFALDAAARSRGLTLMSELGLDPGLDHMSAMRLIHRLRSAGARVRALWSYGSGVADRATVPNPLGYALTWNPRNVVRAGTAGARFLEAGAERRIPYPEVFRRTWPVIVPGEGVLEAYANRDSIAYAETYGLQDAHTLVRATLRHPGFCEAWYALARLGLTSESPLADVRELSPAQLVEMVLPPGEGDLGLRLARDIGLHPTGSGVASLRWLGLFDEERRIGEIVPWGERAASPADALEAILRERLVLPPGGRDLVILHHVVEAEEPEARLATHTSTLVARGRVGGVTAMAYTVGLPVACAALAILEGRLHAPGCPIPVDPSIYEVLLPDIERAGLGFTEALAGRSAADLRR